MRETQRKALKVPEGKDDAEGEGGGVKGGDDVETPYIFQKFRSTEYWEKKTSRRISVLIFNICLNNRRLLS